MKRMICTFCGALMLLMMMPVTVSAAGVDAVYAALRDIGVPEEYVMQAAGVLASGTSDGSGVRRADGTYYSYSDMVGYIYANREMILSFCGVSASTETAVPVTSVTQIASAETLTVPCTSDDRAENASDETTTTTDITTQTTYTTVRVTVTSSETAVTMNEADDTAEKEMPSQPSGLLPLGLGCMIGGISGIAALAYLLKRSGSSGYNHE